MRDPVERIADLETRMRAAADLDFEEAARLRDEIKRLRATELAVVDDPSANVVRLASARDAAARRARPHKPELDEMGIALSHERQVYRAPASKRPRKPTLERWARSRSRRPIAGRARLSAAPECVAAGSRSGGGDHRAAVSRCSRRGR